MPPLPLELENALATLAPLESSELSTIAKFPKLNLNCKILFKIPLLLLAQGGHLLKSDDGRSTYLGLLLLA